jgi:signal transduction histidine kinase
MAEGEFDHRIEKSYKDELGVLADTLNYMAEELQNSENLKNDFISSISHEIRTPLTAIAGWGETIITGDLDDKQEVEKGLSIIIRETNRLSDMVEELLDFSRMESGRFSLYLEKLMVDKEVDEVVEIYAHKADQKGVKLEKNYDLSGIQIEGDRNRLKQVFINVIDNAVKFSSPGGAVSVFAGVIDSEVFIKVKDSGIGIPQSHLNLVTKRFYKGNPNISGSGLGLAITSEIINLHGAKFIIESKENEGTEVIINFGPEIKTQL